jgi:hypothetical protein
MSASKHPCFYLCACSNFHALHDDHNASLKRLMSPLFLPYFIHRCWLFGSLSAITSNLQSEQIYNDPNLQQANPIPDTDTTTPILPKMSIPNDAQWPFVPTDGRPIFFNPEPGTQQTPAYTGRQARKRRHSETSSSNNQPPDPAFPQNHSTYASYLAEQTHLARKVRVTPSLLVNQNSQRFRISDIRDHIVEWARERLKPAAWCVALPLNYLQSLRRLKLALNRKEERFCQHISEKERTKLSQLRNVGRILERLEKIMEEYDRRRRPTYDRHESDSDEDSEIRDAPTRPGPRRDLKLTVEDIEEDEVTDLEDDVDVGREHLRAPLPRRRSHQAPVRTAGIPGLHDDEIEIFMDLRQQYNEAVDELQNTATSKRRSSRSGQQVDAVENEASPPAVQNDGYNNREGSPPSPPGRDDVNDGRNGNSSSSLSDDASDSEGKGQAPPLRHSEKHSSSSPETDLGPIEPRPELVLLPTHLIPAQITRSTRVRRRRRKTLTPTSAQGRTYVEYDRLQEVASQYPSLPESNKKYSNRCLKIICDRVSISRSSRNEILGDEVASIRIFRNKNSTNSNPRNVSIFVRSFKYTERGSCVNQFTTEA